MIIQEANKLNTVKEYYFSQKLQQIADMRKAGKNILNLGIGSPDMMPSPTTIEALYISAQNPDHHGYQSYKGVPELREAIATWLGNTYGLQLNPNTDILPLIGSKEGIMHISMAFINPGDEVLLPNPGYPTYAAVSTLVGAKLRYYDLDESKDWAVDLDKLEQEDLSAVKIMWINYPNMPTGAQAGGDMFERLIRLAKREKFLIVNDNPYSLILNENPASMLSVPGAEEVVLELNSMSKSHNMAGWRMGWVAGQKDYISTILRFKSNMDSGMFRPMQDAAVVALQNTAGWHKEQNAHYAERRSYVYRIFELLNCRYNPAQVGMFVWAKAPEYVADVEAFVEEILQQCNVFITPGFIFGSNGQRYVRISLCSKNEVFEEAIQRIEMFLKGRD